MSWPNVRISDLCTVITKGTTPTTIGHNFASQGAVFLRAQNIIGGTINYEKDTLFIDTTTHNALERSKIYPGDVLVSIAGTIGRVGVVPQEVGALNCNQAVAILRITKRVSGHFLRYWLECTASRGQIASASVKGTISNLSLSQLGEIRIPLPPLDDQIRIATVLTRAEKLISKRKESTKALDALLKSTFLEMFGDPVRNEKGWNVVSIKDLCSNVIDCPHNTPQYSDVLTQLYCIRSADIQNGYLELNTTLQVDASTFKQRNARHIPIYNDIVFTREGGRLGNSARVPRNVNICLGQRIMLFTVNNDRATSEFLWAALNTSTLQQCINNIAGGGAAPRVNIKDLVKIKCYQPPIELQSQFSAIVEKVESLKSKYTQSLSELENLYGSLSQRAFKGELDLSAVTTVHDAS